MRPLPCPPLNELDSPLLLLGPAYSGKSELALQAMKPEESTHVLGTAGLAELEDRIQKLKSLRPQHWLHTERPSVELNEHLKRACIEQNQILIDSINQWLANMLIESWSKYDLKQHEARFDHELRGMLETFQNHRNKRFVVVSSEIGAGVTPPQELARLFRQMLGRAHVMIAAQAASVVQVTAGIPILIKG